MKTTAFPAVLSALLPLVLADIYPLYPAVLGDHFWASSYAPPAHFHSLHHIQEVPYYVYIYERPLILHEVPVFHRTVPPVPIFPPEAPYGHPIVGHTVPAQQLVPETDHLAAVAQPEVSAVEQPNPEVQTEDQFIPAVQPEVDQPSVQLGGSAVDQNMEVMEPEGQVFPQAPPEINEVDYTGVWLEDGSGAGAQASSGAFAESSSSVSGGSISNGNKYSYD